MGLLINGTWSEQWYDTDATDGNFVRQQSLFRNWVTRDGTPGPSGNGGFHAALNRYHLYVSHACPWAHRTLIFRHIKGLKKAIGVSVVHPLMLDDGWTFETNFPGSTGDTLLHKKLMREIYLESEPSVTTRVTVPVLWDEQQNCIVSNESSEIIRMFNSAFNHLTDNHLDLYPKSMRQQIDQVNDWIYRDINNGVYKVGFSTTQRAYNEAVKQLFAALEKLEALLKNNRYLIGHVLTEADWRLFTTLIRFDPVYVGHFKCSTKRIQDYPAIHAYMRELYQMDGIASTVHMDHITHHYYASHTMINPTQIVPALVAQDLWQPHGREALS